MLKKCKKPDDVLFINASDHFEKGKRQNQLTEEHIDMIVDTYQFRKEKDRYSRRVSMDEIVGNDYNLNISRYVSTAQQETDIDLSVPFDQLTRSLDEMRYIKNRGFYTYMKNAAIRFIQNLPLGFPQPMMKNSRWHKEPSSSQRPTAQYEFIGRSQISRKVQSMQCTASGFNYQAAANKSAVVWKGSLTLRRKCER